MRRIEEQPRWNPGVKLSQIVNKVANTTHVKQVRSTVKPADSLPAQLSSSVPSSGAGQATQLLYWLALKAVLQASLHCMFTHGYRTAALSIVRFQAATSQYILQSQPSSF
jgi:hypothetical protein